MHIHISDDYSSTRVDIMYLYFDRTFDKVDHILMHTLKGIGVFVNLGVCIGNFLREQTQCVQVLFYTNNV